MKLLPHVVAGAIISTPVAVIGGEPLAIPVSVAAAVLPDSDHLFDFYWQYIRRSRKRLFILFHGWEFALALFVWVYLDPHWWNAAIYSGYVSQIALDQYGNKAKWHTYIFTLRLIRKFDRSYVFGPDSPGFYIALTSSVPILGPKLKPWFIRREQELFPEFCFKCGSNNTESQEIQRTGFSHWCRDCYHDYTVPGASSVQ